MRDPLEKLGEEKNGNQLATIFALARKRKWMILGITLLIPSLVGFALHRQPKVYQASATIVIDLSVPHYLGADFKDIVEVEPSWWSSRETLETEFRVLKSFTQAQAVARALCEQTIGPQKKRGLTALLPDATCTSDAEYARAAPLIQSALSVEPIRDSRLVQLTVNSNDPSLAAMLANTIAQVYVDRNLERRLHHSQGAASWLGHEFGDLSSELQQAERALHEFKKANNILSVSLESDQSELSSRRKKLAEELNSVEVKLIALRTQREQFANSVKSPDLLLDQMPAVANSPVAQKLRELYIDQYATVVELKGKYLDKYPAVVSAETRLGAIKEDLRREIQMAHKSVEMEYQLLSKQAAEYRSALQDTTKQALALEAKASEFNRLKRELDRLVKLAEHVGGRERETTLASQMKTNNVRILDAALVPKQPVAPKLPRSIGIAAGVGLLLALGLALLLEALDTTVKSQEDIEKTLGATFLGLIPTIDNPAANSAETVAASGGRRDSRDLFVLANPQSSVAECCRAIRTNLLFISPDKPARTILITSAGPQEGKTTVAVNLAITMALSGLKVLLVDTDMRRPRLHKALGLASPNAGLSKAIVGDSEVLDLVRETGVPNLWVLPCGACPPNPAELLHAERFKRIVATLESNYDRVIFDSPPVGIVTDAAILARLTGGTIMVAKAGKTRKEALARARRQLFGTDGAINLLGCILNDLDLSKQAQYGYYYYYYSRYAEDPTPATQTSA